jgi:hypothetical protein
MKSDVDHARLGLVDRLGEEDAGTVAGHGQVEVFRAVG